MSIGWAWIVGLLFGVRHAIDADHRVTLGAIVEAQPGRRSAVRAAMLWGLGQTLIFLCVGSGIVAFGLRLPPMFEPGTEVAVAVLLMGLGLAHLFQSATVMPLSPRVAAALAAPSGLRPLAAGLVHGLAGSAGIALIALTTIPKAPGALVYLGAFGIGTVAGMISLTLFLSSTREVLPPKRPWLRHLTAVTALISVGMGIFLASTLLDRSPAAVSRWHAGPSAVRKPT